MRNFRTPKKGRVVSLEIANAIGLSDGSNCQIVNKFKAEEINTAKSAGRD
jgi:hypothetical protein